MTEAPLFWLKRIESTLKDLQEIPLWGTPPPFPWKQCQEQISTLLQMPEIEIEPRGTRLLPVEELRSGLGDAIIDIPIALQPLAGAAHWLMSQEDIAKLTQLVLSPKEGGKGISSPKFQEGFYRYLTLNILQVCDELNAFEDLSLKLAPEEPIPAAPALCIDVAVKHPRLTLWGRLICPPSFLEAFKTHFSSQRLSMLSSELASEIDLSLRLEVGTAQLSISQWKEVGIGDCVVLDRCTYDPVTHKGTVTVALDTAPLFRARLKENHLKIVDYAFYHEEEQPMDTRSSDPENENEPFEEEDLGHAAPEEEIPESEEENHLWSTKNGEEESVERMIETKEIPLTITVEVGRLKMNLEKLLMLKAGNLIELPVRPEQGVDLVINGKKVAKGELVKLGEALGVKILALGESS